MIKKRKADFSCVGISFSTDALVCSIIEHTSFQQQPFVRALEKFNLPYFELYNGIVRNTTTLSTLINSFLIKHGIDSGYCLVSLDDTRIEHSLVQLPHSQEFNLQSYVKNGSHVAYEQWPSPTAQSWYYVCSVPLPVLFSYIACTLRIPLVCLGVTTHCSALLKGYHALNDTYQALPLLHDISYANFYASLQNSITTSLSTTHTVAYVESVGLFSQGKAIYERTV